MMSAFVSSWMRNKLVAMVPDAGRTLGISQGDDHAKGKIDELLLAVIEQRLSASTKRCLSAAVGPSPLSHSLVPIRL